MRRWATNTDQPVIVLSSNELTQNFNAKAYWAGGSVASSTHGVDDILANPAEYPIGVITPGKREALLVINGEVGEPEATEKMSAQKLKESGVVGIYETGPHFAVLHIERPPFEL